MAALLVGAVYNTANPLGIRWLPSPDGRIGIPRAYESRLPQITVEEAFSIFRSHAAVFVDSRDKRDYDRDYIPGAISFPQRRWVEVWPEMKPKLPRDAAYVLYCYGSHCGLSTRQGKRLLAEGYERLLVLDRGWNGWKEAGHPTDRGPDGKPD